MTYDLRARPLLVLLLLIVAAAGAALLVFERARKTSDSGSAGKPAAVAPKTHSAPASAATARTKPKPKPKAATPADQLPAPIRRALAADDVVVVSLYNPAAKIDGTAMREAQEGAERAGSSFVPIDVRKNNVASLHALYGVLHDPAVLVLRPPGSIVVRIDGFADRDTVAQAALNAAS